MANWLSGLQGTLGGAGTGAAIGSMIAPGIGTAIGGALGGVAGGIGGLFSGGEKGGVKQAQTLNPQQQQILSMLLGQGQQNLQNPYAGFEDISNYAQNQFNQNIVPSIAERFASLGNNALSSGAFATQLGQAGRGLGDTLALLRNQYGQQNQQNALQQLSLGLSPSFQNFYQQSQPGFGENLFNGAIQAAPSLYQSYMLNNALRNIQPR